MSNIRKIKDVVCVLNPDQIYQMQHFGGVDVSGFVTPYEMNALSKEIKMPEIKEKSIYTFIPYQNKYIHLNEQSEDEIILDRISKIETILSYLGAKYCHTTSTSIRKIVQKTDERGRAKVSSSEGSIGIKGEQNTNVHNDESNTIESTVKYPGKYTIDGYKRAKELAEQYQLDNDSVIQQLLEERNPIHPNGIEKKEYKVDVQSDLEQLKKASYELKSKLKTAIGNIEISGSYKESKEYKESIHHTFDFEAEFSPLEVSQKDKELYKGKNKKVWWYIAGAVVVIAAALLIALL